MLYRGIQSQPPVLLFFPRADVRRSIVPIRVKKVDIDTHHLFPPLDPLLSPHGLSVLDCLPVLIGDMERSSFELVALSVFLLVLLSFQLSQRE